MGDKVDEYEYTEEEISAISEKYAAEDAENRRIRAVFLQVFESKAGKVVLKAIRETVCGVNKSCFDESSMSMARRAGRQEVAFIIDEILELARREAQEESDGNRF